MTGSAFSQILFASFAIVIQLCLIAFFAARRWRPNSADRMGAAVYGLAFVAVALAGIFVSTGQPWTYWGALVPYVTLYLTAQLKFWVPLWYISLSIWGVNAGLYAAGTLLNIRGHFRRRESDAHARA